MEKYAHKNLYQFVILGRSVTSLSSWSLHSWRAPADGPPFAPLRRVFPRLASLTAGPAAALLLAVPRRLLGTVSPMTNGTSQYSAEGENSRMDKDVTSPPHFTLHSPMTNPPFLSLSAHLTAVNTQRLA